MPKNPIVACPSLVLPPLPISTLSPTSPVQLIVSHVSLALSRFLFPSGVQGIPTRGMATSMSTSISTCAFLLQGKQIVHRSSFLVRSSRSCLASRCPVSPGQYLSKAFYHTLLVTTLTALFHRVAHSPPPGGYSLIWAI